MLSEYADVYAGAQGYPLFTMSRKPLVVADSGNCCSSSMDEKLVEPVGIEPTTSSLQS